MSHLSWFGVVVYFLSIFAASLLIATANSPVRKGLGRFPLKKIAWGILLVGVMYLYLSIPFVSHYYGSHQQREFPQNPDTDSAKIEVLRDHQLRIENLESELKETKEELLE